MENLKFTTKQKEAEWKEERRQSKNTLDYETQQAQRECADRIEQAQRECADRIEKAQRRHYERIRDIAIREDAFKTEAANNRNARRAQVLAELERIDQLAAKHGLNKEGGEQ